MKQARVLAVVLSGTLLGISTISLAHAHAYDTHDTLLASVGEFEIGNGETHSVAHNKKDDKYRICVHRARNSVPLKVMYDGKEQTVAPGNCTDFEAMNIKITPAAKLEKDTVLIGRYHRVRE